jgi:hypothetical protein
MPLAGGRRQGVRHPCAELALSQSAGSLGGGGFATTHLEAIPAVDGLYVKDLAPCDSQNALDRGGDVFVHPIRELDHDDRALAWGSHEAAGNGPCPLAELSQHHVHKTQSSIARAGVYSGLWRAQGPLA